VTRAVSSAREGRGPAPVVHAPDASLARAAGRQRPLTELGELVGVIYRSDRRTPGRARTYIHFMQDRPRLASDATGRQLYVVGGSYRVTARGIEG
jgi:hypothetical protein